MNESTVMKYTRDIQIERKLGNRDDVEAGEAEIRLYEGK